MTALVGTSVLLIAASALALVFGWVTANESLIWTSIGASVASGVALALAYGRARTEGAAEGAPPIGAAPAGSQAAAAPSAEASEEPKQRTPEKRTPEKRTPEKRTPEKRTPEKRTPEKRTPADQVVGMRHTKRFHKPTCRYALAKNAEPMSKDVALAHGYRPCAICGP